MLRVFVDTGGWIAMAVMRDQFHKQAPKGDILYSPLSRKK
jgi:hypothetical protein